MSILTAPRPRVNAKSRPLTVELTIAINGQSYHVEPIAPGPDNTKAYRLVKRGADEKVYDVCQTAAGLVECDCPSYESTYRGNGLETCKHGRGLIMVGLLGYPDFAVPATDAARDAFEDIAESEAAAPAPAFDADFYRAQNAVAARRALWLSHRHLHTSDPLPAANPARDIVLLDDDGSPLETPAEMDARHRAEHAAEVAELMEGNPFLPACCPDDEVSPCSACVAHHEGPADLSDTDGWDDDARWELGSDDEPGPRSLAVQVEDHARELRAVGSPLHDLLAERAESLASEIRYLDATTVGQYRDRREAALDAARDAAEARMASRCC